MVKVKNVVIVHCYGCDPKSHWFPWLEKEFKKEGVKVFVPDFGQDEVPSFQRWAGILERVLKGVLHSQNSLSDGARNSSSPCAEGLNPAETVLIGHSLGGALIPRVLSEWKGESFLAVFLVATPFTDLGWPTLRPFFKKRVIKKGVARKMGFVKIFASDNDPYVPLEHAYKYQKVLGGEVIVEKGKEHLWQEEYEGLKKEVRALGSR